MWDHIAGKTIGNRLAILFLSIQTFDDPATNNEEVYPYDVGIKVASVTSA